MNILSTPMARSWIREASSSLALTDSLLLSLHPIGLCSTPSSLAWITPNLNMSLHCLKVFNSSSQSMRQSPELFWHCNVLHGLVPVSVSRLLFCHSLKRIFTLLLISLLTLQICYDFLLYLDLPLHEKNPSLHTTP